MRKLLVILAIIFQVVLLASMAGQREFVARNGKTVYLRTRPVDPMDMFRGEYARLDYDISHVDSNLLRDGLTNLTKSTKRESRRVYAMLDVNDNIAGLQYLTDKRPKDGVYIRGILDYFYGDMVDIKYGIEAYFVEQGSSKDLQRPNRHDIALTLEMEAALSKTGVAVLKGYRFAPLAIGIEPNYSQERNGPAQRGQRRLKFITLKVLNASEKPIAIIDLPRGKSFSLEQDAGWGTLDRWQWVGQNLPRDNPQDKDVHILKPDEIYQININLDFTAGSWFVKRKDTSPLPVSELNWERFRFVYRPADKEQCKDLDNADIIWHGYIYSPAFSGSRGID